MLKGLLMTTNEENKFYHLLHFSQHSEQDDSQVKNQAL